MHKSRKKSLFDLYETAKEKIEDKEPLVWIEDSGDELKDHTNIRKQKRILRKKLRNIKKLHTKEVRKYRQANDKDRKGRIFLECLKGKLVKLTKSYSKLPIGTTGIVVDQEESNGKKRLTVMFDTNIRTIFIGDVEVI